MIKNIKYKRAMSTRCRDAELITRINVRLPAVVLASKAALDRVVKVIESLVCF